MLTSYLPIILFLLVIPNDEFFSLQWGLYVPGTHPDSILSDIRAPEAWDIFKGSPDVKVGVIDEGVNWEHEDLIGRVESGDRNFVGSHGTHVAGIIAANTNNTIGIAGVDWHAKIDARAADFAHPDILKNQIIASVNAGARI